MQIDWTQLIYNQNKTTRLTLTWLTHPKPDPTCFQNKTLTLKTSFQNIISKN